MRLKDEELIQLIKACKAGGNEARRKLYEMHAKQMLSVCYRYANTSEDAKDIFQQAFTSVFEKIDQLRDPLSVSGWIKRIVVNTALAYYKNNQIFAVDAIDDFHENFVDSNDPLSQIKTDELLNLIQQLPNGCRKVFNMYAIEGYKHKEIAEELKISVGTSKSQLYDARMLLKAAIINQTKNVKTGTN